MDFGFPVNIFYSYLIYLGKLCSLNLEEVVCMATVIGLWTSFSSQLTFFLADFLAPTVVVSGFLALM